MEEQPKKIRKYGSRHEVFDLGTALMTRGKLTKDDLMISRTGRIVSVKKSKAAAESYKQYGFKVRAKEAEAVEEKTKKPKRRRRKKKTE